MFLMLQRWDSIELELAMLLHETPYVGHQPSETDAPYMTSPNSLLREALVSADCFAYAYLYVVYESDPPRTWGSRRVKLLDGGKIVRATLDANQTWTGGFSTLRYQVVVRHIFENCIGLDSPRVAQVITSANLRADPTYQPCPLRPGFDVPRRLDDPPTDMHPLFGEACIIAPPNLKSRLPAFIPQPRVGACHTYIDEKGEPQHWFINDARHYSKYRFMLTEFANRRHVQQILGILGFVFQPQPASTFVRSDPTPFNTAVVGQLQNIMHSLNAVYRMAASRTLRAPIISESSQPPAKKARRDTVQKKPSI